jgi:hypothetical protein
MNFLFLAFNTAVQTDYALEYNPERDVTISVEWLKRAKVVAPKEIEPTLLNPVLYKKIPVIAEVESNFGFPCNRQIKLALTFFW